jgi:uncharacterized protein YdcH (DUF465 family)
MKITRLGKVKMINERKGNSIKKLQEECKKRNIGFMTSWTKMALIKRLADEDKRDDEILKLKKELDKIKEAPKIITAGLKRELNEYKGAKVRLEDEIKSHHDEKVKLGQLWLENNKKIEELESRIRSLI